jgi:putative phosphoesterase
MKIVIVSDIHGNFDALSALPEAYDELWVLGDLVNYGPEPGPVIDDLKSKATVLIRGNHDHSAGYHQDPRCSARFRLMAEATGRYTDAVLRFGQKHFLRSLPLQAEVERGGVSFYLCHAVPSDPLFGYCDPESDRWVQEIHNVSAEILLVGHTHVPMVRTIEGRLIVNPGSLGQPKTGNPHARYAVWEDGRIGLKSYRYDVEAAVEKMKALPIDPALRDELSSILRSGQIPQACDAAVKENP